MKRLNAIFLMVCCTLCAVPAWSQHTVKGIIKDKETHPVIGASVIIRSLQDTLNHKDCITDENGQFIIEKIESGKYGIEISFIGYTDYRQEFELDQSLDFGEIVLAENTMLLDEVIVTASMVKRFVDKKEYKLTNIEKEQYSSALSALEHLPKIQVVDQTVNSMDGKAVKILINGIPSTPTLEIPKNNSVMFGSLSGTKLGVWVAHGEGKFEFPYEEKEYNIIAKYNYDGYPANPNGSPWSVAGVCSKDGRHLAMMPHPERAIFPWQCGYYPADRKENDEVTPWIEAFVNARKWIENNK